MCGGVCEVNYQALCDDRALRDARCVHRVCVCVVPLLVGFMCRGCVRVRSCASYFPYLCVDTALAMMDDTYKIILSKLCKRVHQGLEEGGVVGPRGGVGLGVDDVSSGHATLSLGSCGG